MTIRMQTEAWTLLNGGSLLYISKIQCFNCRKYGHYKNHCLELKKRKEKHEASIAKEKEPTKKTKKDGKDFFF